MTGSATTTPAPVAQLRAMMSDIKLAHSVFALPYAILAAFLALPPHPALSSTATQLLLVIACMVAARTWAMLVNRLVDRRFDSANPRTAARAFASGRVPVYTGWLAAAGSAGTFVFLTGLFGVLLHNAWPLFLSLPVLAIIALYSLTKRFTALCHLVLGLSLALSPLAAALAIDPTCTGLPEISLGARGIVHGTAPIHLNPALFLIAGMVLTWVAGFDIIYALADIDFDRSRNLHSIPAALGWNGAAWVSRLLHLVSFALLALAWRTEPRFTWIFGAGVLIAGTLLIAEHIVLIRRGRQGLDLAFFTLNGVVSCVLGALGIADCFL